MATGEDFNALPDNWLCVLYNNNEESFPCNSNSLKAVSLGIAAGGMALLFSMYLTSKVRLLGFPFLLWCHADAGVSPMGSQCFGATTYLAVAAPHAMNRNNFIANIVAVSLRL